MACVGDVLIFSKLQSPLDKIIEEFQSFFDVGVYDLIEKFLGMSIVDKDNEIHLHNERIIERVLRFFNMENCKPLYTPLPPGLDVYKEGLHHEQLSDQLLYRQLIGSLLHLANTVRPDLSFGVNYLTRPIHQPTIVIWNVGKHTLQYLCKSLKMGIHFLSEVEMKLDIYSDSDWWQERPTLKSISGYVFILSSGLISWRSKNQTVVAQSFKEAEYIALAMCVRLALWIKKFKSFFKLLLPNNDVDTLLYMSIAEDNQTCILAATGPINSEFSKHIDIRY